MVHELTASATIEKSGKEKSWHNTENADQPLKKTDDMKPGEFFLKDHLFPLYLRTMRPTDSPQWQVYYPDAFRGALLACFLSERNLLFLR